MATHTTVPVPARTWTLLNTGGVLTGANTVVPRGSELWIYPSTSATPPTTELAQTLGVFALPPGLDGGGLVNLTAAQIAPGMTATYLHAWSNVGAAAYVSCA